MGAELGADSTCIRVRARNRRNWRSTDCAASLANLAEAQAPDNRCAFEACRCNRGPAALVGQPKPVAELQYQCILRWVRKCVP